ncbi:MAG: metallophosphoesterase [Candidatus Gastranaerophilales bacterium]|nr:metallophosphoesterase [Candidatus Gastranaerophilales bacterium]
MKKLLKDCCFILFVVIVMLFISDLPSFSGTIKFIQLSDIHYSLVREDTSYKLLSKTRPLLQDAIEQINNQNNIEFVMITGDGIDKPVKDSLYSLTDELNTLKYQWYYVLGNHDTTTDGYLNKTNFVKILKEKNPNFKFDLPYYTFKPKKGFRVIVLDGAKNKGISSNGIIPEEQLQWFDEILSKSKNDTVLIFIHFPLVTPYDSKNHEILNAKEFKAVLSKYNMPIAIFSGHYHAAKITKYGNIIHVSSPALAGYPNAFRMIEVTNKGKQTVFKFDFLETNLKDLQAKTKIMTLGGAIYYGKPKDRDTVITIEKKKY